MMVGLFIVITTGLAAALAPARLVVVGAGRYGYSHNGPAARKHKIP